MVNPIQGNPMASAAAFNPTDRQSEVAGGSSFKQLMLEGIDQVNKMQLSANSAVEQLMTGGDVNAAEVLTSLQKADMSFQMMMQIRNKLVQAYQEIKELRI